MAIAGIADHQLPTAAPTAQDARQQGTASLGSTRLLSTVGVVRHHLLDLLVLLPANVTLMGIRYQRPPTLFLFPPARFAAVRHSHNAPSALFFRMHRRPRTLDC